MAVLWGLQPSEFWRMHPDEWWWFVEAKRPPKEKDKWEELYEMIDG